MTADTGTSLPPDVARRSEHLGHLVHLLTAGKHEKMTDELADLRAPIRDELLITALVALSEIVPDAIRAGAYAGLPGAPVSEERQTLTDLLDDLDWDLSQRADAQDYLTARLTALGGPVPGTASE